MVGIAILAALWLDARLKGIFNSFAIDASVRICPSSDSNWRFDSPLRAGHRLLAGGVGTDLENQCQARPPAGRRGGPQRRSVCTVPLPECLPAAGALRRRYCGLLAQETMEKIAACGGHRSSFGVLSVALLRHPAKGAGLDGTGSVTDYDGGGSGVYSRGPWRLGEISCSGSGLALAP